MSEVRIYEVTPRDGLQNEKALVPTADKLQIIQHHFGSTVDEPQGYG